MYVYLALNKSGSGAYHRYKSTLVPFSQRPIGEIGGERERRSWAPGGYLPSLSPERYSGVVVIVA
jgi:hypothetical protein